MINGRFAKLEGEAEAVKNEGALNIVLDGKLNRVTVFLPNLSKVKLYDAELRDSSRIIPAKKKGKILFYGDSITQGYDAIRPSKSYVNGFCFANDIEPINLGIGGDVFNADNVSEEKIDVFEEKFTENIGEDQKLVADNIANLRKFEVRTPNVTIQVNPDRTDLVNTQIIDGVPCIVIECSDEVEVNGIRVANPM